MILPYYCNNKIAFHLMCSGEQVVDDIYQYNFFGTIHPVILKEVAPGIMKELFRPVRKDNTYIKRLLNEAASRVIESGKFRSTFYPDFLLNGGYISRFSMNQYITALQQDEWGENTHYSMEHQPISFAAILTTFNAYKLTNPDWVNNTFARIDRHEFEQHISNDILGLEYTNNFSKNNNYLKYDRDGDASFILLNERYEPIIVIAL